MKILLVEDSDERIKIFRQWFPTNLDVAEESKEAIQLLKAKQYDTIFLDHDLGGQAFVDSGEGTGYEVAQYIAEHKIKLQVIVHSFNPAGAQNIKNLLPNAILLPFGTFDFKNGELVRKG